MGAQIDRPAVGGLCAAAGVSVGCRSAGSTTGALRHGRLCRGACAMLAGCLMLWLAAGHIGQSVGGDGGAGDRADAVLSSMQLIAMISSSRAHRDAILGNYMVAMSLGQAIGPLFVGLAGWILSGCRGRQRCCRWGRRWCLLRVVPQRQRRAAARPNSAVAHCGDPWPAVDHPDRQHLRDRAGLAAGVHAGAGRGARAGPGHGRRVAEPAGDSLDAVAAAVRAAVRRFGRMRLMLACVLMSGAGLVALALPLPVWAMGVALFAAGFGLGIALTSTIAVTDADRPGRCARHRPVAAADRQPDRPIRRAAAGRSGGGAAWRRRHLCADRRGPAGRPVAPPARACRCQARDALPGMAGEIAHLSRLGGDQLRTPG